MLAYAYPSKPYELHVDAHRDGLGGVLYQESEGRLRPVAYVSRRPPPPPPPPKRTSVYKLEFLALKWAVVEKLHYYPDNNPLTDLLSIAKLDATGHWWLAALSEFHFSLKYRPGAGNRAADALSLRHYFPSTGQKSWVHLPSEGVQAVCQGLEHKHIGAETV